MPSMLFNQRFRYCQRLAAAILLVCNGLAFSATTQKTTRYEAEDVTVATVVGGTLRTWGNGYSGAGAITMPNDSGDSIEWTVSADHAGQAKLFFRYTSGADRPLKVEVNGATVVPSLNFPNSGGWESWTTMPVLTATLNQGSNTVKVTTIGSKGPTMDYLSIIETLPLSGEIMTVYDGANLTGTSATVDATHVVYSDTDIPGGLDNQISSFVLEQGYMAVIADPATGLNPSKVYIAADGPLTVNSLPTEFDNKISFLRVVPWINAKKKGFCGGNDDYRAHFDHSWYYSWTKGVDRGQRTSGPEYAPMCWDERFVQIDDFLAQDQVTHLLSFNEPDGRDQADMPDVVAAVALHKELQKAGLRLGSPACREENAFGTGKWLTDFMAEADTQGVRVDFINVHWYDWGSSPGANPNPDPADVANRLKVYLSNVYKRYRKPIWLTEFNANPARPRSVHDGFLQEIMPYLDDLAYVERYAYYQWPAEAGKTMYFVEPADDSLTTTGQIYNDHQSPMAYLSTEVPSEWQSTDIGGAAAGDTLYNGSYTVVGSGTGLSGASDGCRFVHQPISGDCTITALVTSQIWRNNLSMSGVMIRETLDADSKHATMALSASQGSKFRRRTTVGGDVDVTGDGSIPRFPYWVRLVREGDNFSAYQSPDGIAWTQLGSPQTIAMGTDVHVGMVVTSYNDGNFNDAIFKHVSVTPTLGQSLYIDWTRKSFAGPFTDTPKGSNPDQDRLNNLQEFAFGLDPTSPVGSELDFAMGGNVTQAGTPKLMNFAAQGEAPEYRAVFLRRKDHAAAGLVYSVDFSADLDQWTTSFEDPTILTDPESTGEMEAVSVSYLGTVPAHGGSESLPPRFFRVDVEMP